MFLALKEIRRAKIRFGLLIAAIGMLVFLILFQWTLRNGLLNAFTGAIKNQSSPVLVYTVDGQRFLQASVVPPTLEAQIRSVEGVAAAGRIGQGTFTASTKVKQTTDLSIIGFEAVGLGSPSNLVEGRQPSAVGEAVVSDVDAALGFGLGDTVTVQPGGMQLTVVGRASGVQLNVTPTVFVSYETYLAAVAARNPDAGSPLPNAIAVAPVDGVSPSQLADSINKLSDDVDALTREDAATKAPGVAQVTSSFWIIFLLYGIVVPLVAGLFFVIITFQKAGALTLLRAIGAPSSRLISSLLCQVLIVMGLGLALGIGMYAGLASGGRLGGIAIRFESAAVTGWTIVLLAFGLLSALVAARRVNAIDPATAAGGGGVGR